MPRTPQKWRLPPNGQGIFDHTTRTVFDGNGTKCTEVHETHVFQFPTSPQSVEELLYSAQNNPMSSTDILVNCAQPFPIGCRMM